MPPGDAPRVRLGELLVQSGVLTEARLAEALAAQQSEPVRRRLGQVLVERGFVDETQLTQVLGRQLSVPWVSLYHVDFSRQLLNLVPREVAEAYGIIPVYVRHVRGQGDTLYVATDDPTNDDGQRRVAAYAGLPVRPMIASASDIRAAIRVYYGTGPAQPAAPAPAQVAAPAPAAPAPPAAQASRKPDSVPPTRRESGRMKAASPNEPLPKVIVHDPPPAPVAAAPAPTPAVDLSSVASEPLSAAPSSPAPTVPEVPHRRGRAPVDEYPEIEAVSIPIPAKKKAGGRTIALTLLDGTQISLPAPARKGRHDAPESETRPGGDAEDALTARDLVAALRAVSHGADASEILGENPRWEALFAALLSLLLKKRLIADWEFVEEFRKI